MHARIAAQTEKEMVYLDYMYEVVPSNGNYSWEQHNLGMHYSKDLAPKVSYGLSLNMRRQQSLFYDSPKNYGMEEPDELYRMETRGTLSWQMTDRWKLDAGFSIFTASDFKEALDLSEIQHSGKLVLATDIGTTTPNQQLNFGFGYGILRKHPLLYPIISFSRSLSKNINVDIGFPRTTVHYSIDEWHEISTSGSFKGEYTNIHLPAGTPDDLPHGEMRLAQYALDVNIGYTYKIQPQWYTLIKVGYLINNTAVITDGQGNIAYDLSTEPSVYLSMGLTFKIRD